VTKAWSERATDRPATYRIITLRSDLLLLLLQYPSRQLDSDITLSLRPTGVDSSRDVDKTFFKTKTKTETFSLIG